MVKDMATIAAECVRHPRGPSVWAPELDKYVCPNSRGEAEGLGQEISEQKRGDSYRVEPGLSSQFKLVFLTAAAGTLLFVLICVVLTMIGGREPPNLLERLVMGLFDLSKIGFGAIVGLLGEKSLEAQGT
jgi:hypothetical protein